MVVMSMVRFFHGLHAFPQESLLLREVWITLLHSEKIIGQRGRFMKHPIESLAFNLKVGPFFWEQGTFRELPSWETRISGSAPKRNRICSEPHKNIEFYQDMDSEILLKYCKQMQYTIVFSFFFLGVCYTLLLRFEDRKASIDEKFVSKLQADTGNIQERAFDVTTTCVSMVLTSGKLTSSMAISETKI